MRQPGGAGLGVAPRREAIDEANLRRPAVAVGQAVEPEASRSAVEFGRQFPLRRSQRSRLGRVIAIGIAELDHEVVLRAVDAQPVPEMFMSEDPDVGDVLGGEPRCQFDDDAARFQFQVQGVRRVQRAPGVGGCGIDDFLRAPVLGGFRCDGRCRGEQGRQAEGQQTGKQQGACGHGRVSREEWGRFYGYRQRAKNGRIGGPFACSHAHAYSGSA